MPTHRGPAALTLVAAFVLAACQDGTDATDSRVVLLMDQGPALATEATSMEAALRCTDASAPAAKPVLLVHGTGADAEIAWNHGLVPVLRRHGYAVCAVDLPDHSWGDAQLAAEYVVHAVRGMTQRSGQRVNIASHSQGVMQMVWATKWWPDVEASVDQLIGLAGINHGVELRSNICATNACPPSAWQMDRASEFLAAMNRDREVPGDVSYTSIYSETDTTAPYPTPHVDGAQNIAVQALCPGRDVGHSQILADAAAVALVLDVLAHGHADTARIDQAVCSQDYAEGIDAMAFDAAQLNGQIVYAATITEAGIVMSEPALASYAR